MTITRIIDCIGASDEDVAHLRLLLRSSIIHLQDAWRWGAEAKADLVVVDPRSLVGDSALRRTQRRGVAWAQVIGAEDPTPDGRYLRKPFRREEFVALLNGIGQGSGVLPMQLVTQGEDFFDLDLGESLDEDVNTPDFDISLLRSEREREQDAFEALFHRDPLEDSPQFLMPESLEEETPVQLILDSTARSQSQAADHGNPFQQGDGSGGFVDPEYRRNESSRADELQLLPLTGYLQPGALGGPAVIGLPGVPELVLDPKNEMFHSEGKLSELEAYFRQPLRRSAWKRLINAELARWRDRAPGKPYLRLLWADRYVNSGGYLAKHLDPGGMFRIKRWLELANDYPRAFRVGANMGAPRRLADIARTSGVPLVEVFDIVNAYDAIGYLEWTRRQQAAQDGKP